MAIVFQLLSVLHMTFVVVIYVSILFGCRRLAYLIHSSVSRLSLLLT